MGRRCWLTSYRASCGGEVVWRLLRRQQPVRHSACTMSSSGVADTRRKVELSPAIRISSGGDHDHRVLRAVCLASGMASRSLARRWRSCLCSAPWYHSRTALGADSTASRSRARLGWSLAVMADVQVGVRLPTLAEVGGPGEVGAARCRSSMVLVCRFAALLAARLCSLCRRHPVLAHAFSVFDGATVGVRHRRRQ